MALLFRHDLDKIRMNQRKGRVSFGFSQQEERKEVNGEYVCESSLLVLSREERDKKTSFWFVGILFVVTWKSRLIKMCFKML